MLVVMVMAAVKMLSRLVPLPERGLPPDPDPAAAAAAPGPSPGPAAAAAPPGRQIRIVHDGHAVTAVGGPRGRAVQVLRGLAAAAVNTRGLHRRVARGQEATILATKHGHGTRVILFSLLHLTFTMNSQMQQGLFAVQSCNGSVAEVPRSHPHSLTPENTRRKRVKK